LKVLLDTNIIIHREASTVINENIGILFHWLDRLHYTKYIHPLTVKEISQYKDPRTLKTLNIKLGNYHVLQTIAPIHHLVQKICTKIDKDENDKNDTVLLNELLNDRIDYLITEDKKILHKATLLSAIDRVFTIDSFLEKVTAENPTLVDYKVLAVKKDLFGNIDLKNKFFDSFREDYLGFEKWFNAKSEETAYICCQDDNLLAFLYVKPENENENYSDIEPVFSKKRRLKIGTFKVTLNGYKIGERFLKIIFDNALRFKVNEIYVTTFAKSVEQQRLINLLEDYGFVSYGYKKSSSGKEYVYVRDFTPRVDIKNPKMTFPFVSANSNAFIVPIYSAYHTDLLPDSILKTESPSDFEENEPFRNAISKVYISHAYERNFHPGDLVVFYRADGSRYRSVITTIGIVEGVTNGIQNDKHFLELCGKRSVLPCEELLKWWNRWPNLKPFVMYFLYAYSFPKRLTLNELINLKILTEAPRFFTKISVDNFKVILKGTKTDASIIVG